MVAKTSILCKEDTDPALYSYYSSTAVKTAPIMSMPFDTEVSYLFASFLRHVSENATSYWFLIIENDAPSKATAAVRKLWSEGEKLKHKNIEIMNESSVQQYGGLNCDEYIAMLLKLKLVRTQVGKIGVKPDMWKSFFIFHNIDAEMDVRKPLGTPPSANYMRIGRKEDLSYTKGSAKTKHCVFAPPRCGGIDNARRELREGLRRLLTQDDLDKRNAMSTAAVAKISLKRSQNNSIEATNDSGNNNVPNKDNGEDVTAKKLPKYPIMDMFKINPDDFSSERGPNNLKRLIGELITLQQEQSGNKNIAEFYKLQQNKSDTAVIIKSHKNDKAFERYHRSSPYIEEVIRCMDSDEDVAVKRLSSYLRKKRKSNSSNAGDKTLAKKRTLNSDTDVVCQKRTESRQQTTCGK